VQYSTKYIVLFATAVCLVCSLLVSFSAVSLQAAQEFNRRLDKKKSVLMAARIIKPGESLSAAEIEEKFENIKPVVVDLETGEVAEDVDAQTFEPDDAPKMPADPNPAGIKQVPKYALTFHVLNEAGDLEMIVLPIYGKGLWSTLYGYLALDKDGTTIRGITYYEHGETPGLGGEVDNPKWKNRWPGREAYDEEGDVAIQVIKGAAGPPQEEPHKVDGLSGATITSRGVTYMLQYWLGPMGFGPYLDKFQQDTETERVSA